MLLLDNRFCFVFFFFFFCSQSVRSLSLSSFFSLAKASANTAVWNILTVALVVK